MAILPNPNDNVAIGYDNPWGSSPYESIAIGRSSGSWGTIDGTVSHNYHYDYDKLWEYLYYTIFNKETDETIRNTYSAVLLLNKNDYRNTVLQIELEKNESLSSN